MIELKLDAFLLTPIQRICQYPLQLNELLKLTPPEHEDYHPVQQALNAMRDVASYINERKRRIEYAEILHKWQKTVENWQVGECRREMFSIWILFFIGKRFTRNEYSRSWSCGCIYD